MKVFWIAAACAAAMSLSSTWAQQRPAPGAAFAAALAEQRPRQEGSRIGALSDYLPALAGTEADSPVYFIDPLEPRLGAPAILILGGTHGDEIAGVMAASLFVSWARPKASRLIVIPRANASAASYPDPDRPGPPFISIQGASGERRFRYGSRFTSLQAEILPDP
ncbi:MAG TPA: hypothetical protein VIO60_01705, partial [Rectinemataceae bacterium]